MVYGASMDGLAQIETTATVILTRKLSAKKVTISVAVLSENTQNPMRPTPTAQNAATRARGARNDPDFLILRRETAIGIPPAPSHPQPFRVPRTILRRCNSFILQAARLSR